MIERTWQVNGVPCTVRIEPLEPLLRVLREELLLSGTKEGCGEGECGACTVLVEGLPVTACLLAAGQLEDGSHIETIEGIATTPLGRILAECFVAHGAVQCGICIPGMIVAGYALLRDRAQPTEAEVRDGISGNLCRCTGYAKIVTAILEAGERGRAGGVIPIDRSAHAADEPRVPEPPAPPQTGVFFTPHTLAEALALRARFPDCTILAGGTDLMVGWHAAPESPAESARAILSLTRVGELHGARREDGQLVIGAATSVETILRDPQIARCSPALTEAARSLGARQIRHLATIGGNITNGSPAADLVPALAVSDAQLVLASARGRREVALADFFRGYKQIDLRPDEILTEIRVRALRTGEREGFRKLGTRRAQSIAKVCAAMRLLADRGQVAEVAIAVGSVAPTVLRLSRTEERLRGRTIDAETLIEAGEWAAGEVNPITDIRSTADYRRAMAGVLIRDLLADLSGASDLQLQQH